MFRCIALVLLQTVLFISAGEAAEEGDCTRYVPSVGKVIRAPCDDGAAKSAPPASPSAPDAAAPTPFAVSPSGTEILDPDPETNAKLQRELADMKSKLNEYTEALNSASADAEFRDSYCTMQGVGQWMHQVKEKTAKDRLLAEHIALEKKLGVLGKKVYTAQQDDVMRLLLSMPITMSAYGKRMDQTPEGHTFIRTRHEFRMACTCVSEPELPRRILCCDACDQDELQAKARRHWTSR